MWRVDGYDPILCVGVLDSEWWVVWVCRVGEDMGTSGRVGCPVHVRINWVVCRDTKNVREVNLVYDWSIV